MIFAEATILIQIFIDIFKFLGRSVHQPNSRLFHEMPHWLINW